MAATWLYTVTIFAFTGIVVNHAATWSYTGKTGPAYWHELFPEECSGKHQSPIDIRPDETVFNPHLKEFALWYDPPKPDSKMYIKNNGHTVQVDLEGDFFITNAGLENVYAAIQFHFHWGHKAHHGSEHLYNGEASPIEMHVVTYNQEVYPEIGTAVVSKGGLAVLGTMYEISEEDNPVLEPIVRALKHIRDPESHEKVELPLMSLRDLLPKDITRYYRYNGSLTTPGCFESVIWSLFDDKQTISRSQLMQFTKLMQFKPYHKIGHDDDDNDDDDHHRRRRSLKRTHREKGYRHLTKAERQKERRAEHVLEELGIKGDAYEEAVLKSELIHQKMMMSDMSYHDSFDGYMADDPFSVVKADDDLDDDKEHDGIKEKEMDDIHEDTMKKDDHNDHDDDDSLKELARITDRHEDGQANIHGEVEIIAPEDMYTQEAMVNNFRPVQPLNDRTVYRSFHLYHQIEVEVDEHKVWSSRSRQSVSENDKGNKASQHKLSLTAVVILLITTYLFP